MARHPKQKTVLEDTPLVLDPNRFSPENRQRLSGPALRAFAGIADLWQLTEADRLRVLGLPGRSTFHGWMAKARAKEAVVLPVDTLLRLSAVLGIHKSLTILFGRGEDAVGWLRRPNDGPLFGGQPPLALVVGGTQDGLMLVRRHLDAWRGGVFAAPNAADRPFTPMTDDDIVVV